MYQSDELANQVSRHQSNRTYLGHYFYTYSTTAASSRECAEPYPGIAGHTTKGHQVYDTLLSGVGERYGGQASYWRKNVLTLIYKLTMEVDGHNAEGSNE